MTRHRARHRRTCVARMLLNEWRPQGKIGQQAWTKTSRAMRCQTRGARGGPRQLPPLPVTPVAHQGRTSRREPKKENAAMATQTLTKPEQDQTVEKKIQQLREVYRDAPEMAKVALENALPSLKSLALEAQASQTESAGRIGIRLGSVSELTVIAPFAPGGARRLRTVLQLLNGNFSAGKKVGTLHDMRFVFLDNDTKFLFATAFDGEWDPYIDDFATKIPDEMDIIFSAFEGWPGIHSPEVKDWIVKHQIPAEGWYVAHPDLTVAESARLKRVGNAVEEFLDKIGG